MKQVAVLSWLLAIFSYFFVLVKIWPPAFCSEVDEGSPDLTFILLFHLNFPPLSYSNVDVGLALQD